MKNQLVRWQLWKEKQSLSLVRDKQTLVTD